MENGARIAATAGLRIAAEWLFRKALALRKRLPPKPFTTPEDYFRPYLATAHRTLIRHDIKLVERAQDVATLARAITSQRSSVVIVHGSPGQGKSRFALELARTIGRDTRWLWEKVLFRRQKWKVYFVNTDLPDVLTRISELPRGNPVALFVEDASMNTQVVRGLANYAATAGGQPLALIFTARSYLLPTLLDAMPPLLLGRVHSHDLGRLSREGVAQIFEQLLPGLSRADKNRFIHLTKDSPFLTVLLCEAIRSGVPMAAHLSDEQMRRQLCDEPIERATTKCGAALPKVLTALAGISAVAPYDKRNAALKRAIKDLAEMSESEFNCIVHAAVESGLFLEYGAEKIRPAPDLVGDLILDRVLVAGIGQEPSALARSIIEQLLPHAPERVLANMADLGWTKGDASIDVIGPVLRTYRQQALSLGTEELHSLVERLQSIAMRRPQQALDVIEVLWQRIRDMGDLHDDRMRAWRQLLGNAIPVLEGATYTEDGLIRSMVLLRELYKNGAVDTAYDNHKPLNLLIEAAGFSPYRSLQLTGSALSELELWFDRGARDAVVALEALDHVLSSTVSWTESGGGSITFSSQVLNLNEEVIRVRDRAVTLVERGILSPDAQISQQALITVDSLGRYRTGPGYTPNSPVAARIKSEQLRLADPIERALADGRPYRVMRELEKCLWRWWCFANDDVANRSADLLERVPNDPSYQLSKALFGSDVPLQTDVPDAKHLGASTRAEYFFHEGRDEFSVGDVQAVLDRLTIGPSAEQWATFLRDIAKGEGHTTWRARAVFEAIGLRQPGIAIALATAFEQEPWSNEAATLLSAARESDKALWQSQLEAALKAGGLSDRLLLAWLASLDWRHHLDGTQAAFVDKCVATGLSSLLNFIVDRLAHGAGFPWEESVQRLFAMLKLMPNNVRVLDLVYSKLAHGRPLADVAKGIAKVDQQALQHLLSLPADRGVPWDKPHWVGPYLKFIAAHYPAEFLDFLQKSLGKLSADSVMYFNVLGARNAIEPIKALLSGADRDATLVLLFEIAAQDTASGALIRSVFRTVLPVTEAVIQKQVKETLEKGEIMKAALLLSAYRFSLAWLELCKETLVAAETMSQEIFAEVTNELSGPFWEGETSRSLGTPSERDRQISLGCAEFSDNTALPPRTREFFRKCKQVADKAIQRDLQSDEELLGERL